MVGSLEKRLVLILIGGVLGRGIPPGDGANGEDMCNCSEDGNGESAWELKGPPRKMRVHGSTPLTKLVIHIFILKGVKEQSGAPDLNGDVLMGVVDGEFGGLKVPMKQGCP